MHDSRDVIFDSASLVCLCLCLAGAVSPMPAAAQAVSSELSGLVLADDSLPLRDVVLTIPSSGMVARTDAAGRFHFSIAPLGEVRLQARAVGYVPKDTLLNLESRGNYEVRLQLLRFVPQLDTVQVSSALPYGKPSRYAHTGKFDDFYERRAKRPGSYFTREDVERSGRSRLSDLVSSVPGVSIGFANGQASVRVARCTATSVGTGSRGQGSQAYKWLAVYVDGQRLRADPVETLSQMSTSEIETVEVYRGVSQLPMEATGDACAAIFVTTRYTPGPVIEGNK